jgi:hypothetical protein
MKDKFFVIILYKMRKTTRKNKRNGKQILRKKQTSRKNRKISGGYEEINKR